MIALMGPALRESYPYVSFGAQEGVFGNTDFPDVTPEDFEVMFEVLGPQALNTATRGAAICSVTRMWE